MITVHVHFHICIYTANNGNPSFGDVLRIPVHGTRGLLPVPAFLPRFAGNSKPFVQGALHGSAMSNERCVSILLGFVRVIQV